MVVEVYGHTLSTSDLAVRMSRLGRVVGLEALLAILAGFGIVFGSLAWIAFRVRRRGGGESLMGPFDEIWHPAAHRARIEIHAQDERPAPNPLPGDRLV
ncbi:MAG: hypothetical protein JO287_12385 [Pseudonocardiales bacterium]|nr:hypothetical protein [Pseudonocardiales bacterium]